MLLSMEQGSIGGFRMLRRLGEGSRAIVLLGHPEQDPDAAPVAIKAFRDGVPEHEPVREAAMLSRAAGAHVVRLLDVVTALDGSTALVLERVTGGSLARLLARRETITEGEAITVLAPIAATLLRLHESGVVHSRLSPEAVHFDADGSPVLLGFGAARPIEPGLPPARLATEPHAIDDLDSFRRLADAVLHRLPASPAVDRLRSPWPEAGDRHGLLRDWIDRLFDLAEPLPIRFPEQLPGTAAPLPSRLPLGQSASAPAADAVLPSVGLPAWLEGPISTAVQALGGLLGRLRGGLPVRLGSVRRRVWVPAALVAAALVAAVMMLPGGGAGADPAGTAAEPALPPDPAPAQAALTDDPVEAAAALLQQRERCLLELSVLCLDAVGQAGSAALVEDQQLLRALQSGGELPQPWRWDPAGFELIERLGDSALVGLGDVPETQPTSLLLMQGEAGWRIRGYLQQ